MGGFLQSVIFGYGGLRPKDDRLEIRPTRLPKHCTELRFTGLKYLGNSLNMNVTNQGSGTTMVRIVNKFHLPGSPNLFLHKTNPVQTLPLDIGKIHTFLYEPQSYMYISTK